MANQHTKKVGYKSLYVTDTEKECRKCGQIKPHSDFHRDKSNIVGKGLAHWCKECACKNSRKNHAARGDDDAYKQARRDSYFNMTYGISLEDRRLMLQVQDHKCAICSETLAEEGTGTHLDHCHSTGRIRSLLCTNCNRGLGHFKDSPELLKVAAEYVAKYKENG